MPRPTREQLVAARDRLLPDVIAPGLDVVFSGINPGLYSAYTGYHFARPGNRFWPALHGSGFTARLLAPNEQNLLPAWGIGITNLVPRATARADELTAAELAAGGKRLAGLAERYHPRVVAIVGITAYRAAFARSGATIGPQPEPLGPSVLWVLPNPSGLNAHYQLPGLIAEFSKLRNWLGAG